MTEDEARELKVGDRVRLRSGRVCEVTKTHERGVILEYWPVRSAHGAWVEYNGSVLANAEKIT